VVGSVTTKQSERWSRANGKVQHYRGQDLLKEQDDEPADVWIYFARVLTMLDIYPTLKVHNVEHMAYYWTWKRVYSVPSFE
jgi:hypothetical protein